jgi:hypothetical protein
VLDRIVSGGQTGADRGGLEAARALGIDHGGWCPRGRRAEDGRVPDRYRLRETPEVEYEVRTRWNVRDSDGTLLIGRAVLTGGSRLTAEVARELGRPLLQLDVERLAAAAARELRAWLAQYRIRVLNVAGPRESEVPGIAAAVEQFLRRALAPTTPGGAPRGL